MAQVFHDSTHKVAGGRITAKVSCPYLGRSHRYTRTHTNTRGKGVQGEEGIKAKGRGRGRALETTCRRILLSTDRHPLKIKFLTLTQLLQTQTASENLL